MTQQTGAGDTRRAGPSPSLKDRIDQERHDARATVEAVREDVSDKASRLASEAKVAAGEKLEDAQHGIGSGLKSIGGALRAAGEHLSGERQDTAARITEDAASGLDRLSDSLQNRSLEEVVGDLREFGRRNAGGLFAGSLLAGLAVGRLMKVSGSRATRSGSNGGGDGGGAGLREDADLATVSSPATSPARPAVGREPSMATSTTASPAAAAAGAAPPSATRDAPAGAAGAIPPHRSTTSGPGGTR